jgi:hypothetical protein
MFFFKQYHHITFTNLHHYWQCLSLCPFTLMSHLGQALQKSAWLPLLGSLSSIPGSYSDREEQNKQTNKQTNKQRAHPRSIIHIAYIKYEHWQKCELRQKLICVSTHIVNLSYNGAGRSDECVKRIKCCRRPVTDFYITKSLKSSSKITIVRLYTGG